MSIDTTMDHGPFGLAPEIALDLSYTRYTVREDIYRSTPCTWMDLTTRYGCTQRSGYPHLPVYTPKLGKHPMTPSSTALRRGCLSDKSRTKSARSSSSRRVTFAAHSTAIPAGSMTPLPLYVVVADHLGKNSPRGGS